MPCALKHWYHPLKSSCRVRSENENVGLAGAHVVTVNIRRISKLLGQLILQRNHRLVVGQRVTAKLKCELMAAIRPRPHASPFSGSGLRLTDVKYGKSQIAN